MSWYAWLLKNQYCSQLQIPPTGRAGTHGDAVRREGKSISITNDNSQMDAMRLNSDVPQRAAAVVTQRQQSAYGTDVLELSKKPAQVEQNTRELGEELKAKMKTNIHKENEVLNLKMSRLQPCEHEVAVVESIKTQLAVLGFILSAAAGISFGNAVKRFASRYITPSLVRETSRFSTFKHMMRAVQKPRIKKESCALQDVALGSEIEQRLRRIALSTKIHKQSLGVYRNLLMYGSPETSKTTLAKLLAERAGMDYAILTGADLADSYSRDGPKEIFRILDWASTSRKGLMIIIDNAETFLRKDSNEEASFAEEIRMSTWRICTNYPSSRFMLILTSSALEQLISTINYQDYEVVEF